MVESVSADALDVGSLVGNGGLSAVLAVAAWRLSTAAKQFVDTFKQAVAQWREDAKAQRAHFESEENLLRELRDERKTWDAAKEAEANWRRSIMQVNTRLDSIDDRIDRAIARAGEDRGHG